MANVFSLHLTRPPFLNISCVSPALALYDGTTDLPLFPENVVTSVLASLRVDLTHFPIVTSDTVFCGLV